MAKQEQELVAGQRIGNAYRQAAGLPERESDAPVSDGDPSERTRATEPEGGYGGEGGISNVSAINASEHPGGSAEGEEPAVDEAGLTGGETTTEQARVTGEDTVDVKPGTDGGEPQPGADEDGFGGDAPEPANEGDQNQEQ